METPSEHHNIPEFTVDEIIAKLVKSPKQFTIPRDMLVQVGHKITTEYKGSIKYFVFGATAHISRVGTLTKI